MKYVRLLFALVAPWTVSWAQPTVIFQTLKKADSLVQANKDAPYDSILYYAEQQQKMARMLRDSFEVGKAYISLSYAYRNSDRFYGEEVASILSAKKIFTAFHDQKYIALCNLELGIRLKEMSQNLAPPYLFQALAYFKETHDSTNLCRTLMELALYHRNHFTTPHYGDSALFYYKNALRYATTGSLTNRIYNNLADYYTLAQFEDLPEAARLSKMVIHSPEKSKPNLTVALLNLAIIYKTLHNDSSFYYLQKGYELAKDVRPIRLLHQANYLMYEYYHEKHDLEKALFHYQQFTQTDRNAIKNVALLEMFLKNENRDALTAKALSELQQKDLNRHKVLLYVIGAFTSVLVLLVIMIVRQNSIIKTDYVFLNKKNEEVNSLMREIHHRVKNNLQMIISLLNLQRSAARNSDVVNILNDTSTRIKAITFIHQKLYRGNTDMITIGFKAYTLELCENIIFSYGMAERIDLHTDIDEIQISFDNATLVGLLITELITNALKHGFTPASCGKLDLSIKNIPNEEIKIVLKDNGIGIPENFNIDRQQSFGVDLIRSLVAQLEGSVKFTRENGTLVTISIPQPRDKK